MIPRTTQPAARKESDSRNGRGGSVARSRPLATGTAQEDETDDLREAEDRKCGGHAQARKPDRPEQPVTETSLGRHAEECLPGQPLRREAVEGRDPGDRGAADEERPPGDRHPSQEPAERVDVEASGDSLERPGAEEEQALADGVVERVQQRRCECDRGPGVGPSRAEQECRTDGEDDDPDVLDRAEREQPLEIPLEEGVDDPADRGEEADAEDDRADPERQDATPLDEDADEPVEQRSSPSRRSSARRCATAQSGARAAATSGEASGRPSLPSRRARRRQP